MRDWAPGGWLLLCSTTLLGSLMLLCSLAACAQEQADVTARAAPVSVASPAMADAGGDAKFDLNRYLATLNRQCAADSDCEVKDVGNCCGYFPQCVAKNATPQKEAVRTWCERNEVKSICGFQEIQGCACVAGRCTAAAGGQ